MESYDSLKNTPRVKATDEAGIPKGAFGILPYRQYPRPGVAESWLEAVSNANKRIAGDMPPIKGSIDDESPELYSVPPKLSPYGYTFAPQKGSLDEKAVDAMRAPKEVGGPREDDMDTADEPEANKEAEEPPKRDEGMMPAYESSPEQDPPKKRRQKKQAQAPQPPPPQPSGRYAPEMLPGDPFAVPGAYRVQSTPIPHPEHAMHLVPGQPVPVQYVEVPKFIEKVVEKPVEKIVEKVVEKPVETAFSTWSKQRVRVTIATPEMQFSVSAIAVARALYSIVVFLPTTGDSFAFVPKAGTNIRVGYQNKVEDTVFTGVTFTLDELGLMGLCFLVKSDASRPAEQGS